MKIYKNKEGKMDINKLKKDTTIKNYLNEIDNFLETNPVPCFSCKENCCKRDWNIELDIVFFNRFMISKDNLNNVIDDIIYINELFRPVFKDNPCKFLYNYNMCSIYPKRPYICRAYNCYPETEKYKILKDLILEALNFCLLVKLQSEYQEYDIINKKLNLDMYKLNINKLPLSVTNYQIKICKLIKTFKNLLDDYRYNKFFDILE